MGFLSDEEIENVIARGNCRFSGADPDPIGRGSIASPRSNAQHSTTIASRSSKRIICSKARSAVISPTVTSSSRERDSRF